MPEAKTEQEIQEAPEATQKQDDVEALHAEIADLRRQVADSVPQQEKHTGRKWGIALLIILGSILLIAANATFWLRGVVLNTDRWVSTVAPLSQNETIVDVVSLYVVGGLFDLVEAQPLVEEILPQELGFLSGPAVGVLETLVRDTVSTIIASDEFNAVWIAVNRTVHGTVMSILRGEGNLAYLRNGQLVIDLSDIFDFVGQVLALDTGRQIVPDDWSRIVLLENQQVAVLQQALSVLNTVGLLLPLASIVAFVIAWWISLWRRKTVQWIGIGVVISMVLTILLLLVAQPLVLGSIADPLIRTVVGELWDIVLRLLYIQTIVLLVIGFLIALGTVLAGPHPRAVAIRTGASNWWGNLRGKEAG